MTDWLKADPMTARQKIDLPPVWLIGFIGLVWLQVWLWPGATLHLPLQGVIGAVLFWSGLALIAWAVWAFRRHGTSVVPHQRPARLITAGPFAFSRNPIYLGDLLILTGVIVSHGAWPALILPPLLAVILQRRFIASEEARLKESFGDEFDKYADKTRRWL